MPRKTLLEREAHIVVLKTNQAPDNCERNAVLIEVTSKIAYSAAAKR